MLNNPWRRKAEEGIRLSNISSALKLLKLLCMKIESQCKSSSQCKDIFSKSSWVFPFLSLLLTIALFLRMEAINNKTEINDMRIYKVESQMKIVMTLHATDDENVKLSRGRRGSALTFFCNF